jgi:hypothetical protein
MKTAATVFVFEQAPATEAKTPIHPRCIEKPVLLYVKTHTSYTSTRPTHTSSRIHSKNLCAKAGKQTESSRGSFSWPLAARTNQPPYYVRYALLCVSTTKGHLSVPFLRRLLPPAALATRGRNGRRCTRTCCVLGDRSIPVLC